MDYIVTYKLTGEQTIVVRNCRSKVEAIRKAKKAKDIDIDSIYTDFNVIPGTYRSFEARPLKEEEDEAGQDLKEG